MADSTIQALASLTPAKQDLILAVDQSDSYGAKKLTLEALMNFVLGNTAAFDISSGKLRLKDSLNANEKKIVNLSTGDSPGDAVNYATVAPMIQSLEGLKPATPEVTGQGPIRAAVTPVTDPWGGFYYFYWCVDDSPATELSVSGGSVVASSGATVYVEGAVANVISIARTAEMNGKYIHVAVRYRNFASLSKLSNSGTHLVLHKAAFDDLIGAAVSPPEGFSVCASENQVILEAQPPVDANIATTYVAELLFDGNGSNEIQGMEKGLIRIYSNTPKFVYDIPLLQAQRPYCHARIGAVAFDGTTAFTDTKSEGTFYDPGHVHESFLSLLAARLSERLTTQGGEPLLVKNS